MIIYLIGLILAFSAGHGHGKPSQTIEVNPAVQYQQFQGWGTSLAWFAHILGSTPDSVRNKYADLIFDKHKGLGLNIVRYNIGGGENPKYHFMEPRAAVPGFEPKPGHFNWQADQNQRWFLRAAMQRGVNIEEAFSNSPPYWMTRSGSVTGAKNGGNNLNPKYEQQFADYLVKVDRYFRDHLGIRFNSLEPFNEPISRWWKFGNRQEGCHFSRGEQDTVLKMVGRDLQKAHLKTELSVPDENSINQTIRSFRSYDATAKRLIDKINTHGYHGNERHQLYQVAKKYSKRLWMSEYGDGDASGLSMSEEILKDLKIMHASAWIYWQAVDGGGWGMLVTPLNSGGPYPIHYNEKYYVMANYSKFIRPGDYIVKIGGDQSLAAYNPSNHRLVVVTTNKSSNTKHKKFHIRTSDSINKKIRLYQTTKNHSLHLETKQLNNHDLPIKLPAQSVTTIIFSNVHPNQN